MKIEAILGKLILLTKEIKIRDTGGKFASKKQFLTGKSFLNPIGSIGLEWYYTYKSREVLEDIAQMAISDSDKLKNGDVDFFVNKMQDIIEQTVFSCKLYDEDKIFLRSVDSLFEAKANIDGKEFAERLWSIISNILERSIDNWITTYPLTNISTKSFAVGYDGISVLGNNDYKEWEKYKNKFTAVNKYSPFLSPNNSQINIIQNPAYPCLVCEADGTQNGATFRSGYLMRKFIAVFSSFIAIDKPYLLMTNAVRPESRIYLFPEHPEKVGSIYVSNEAGTILPSFINNISITDDIIENIKKWYSESVKAEPDKLHRATKGAHFIQYAMMSSEVERFIYYFIALDAFFGIRNKVEKSIKNGVEKVFNDNKWAMRAEFLFNLRNELMHGASSHIGEWSSLYHYKRTFKSTPLRDVEIAALTSLRKYFEIEVPLT